MPRLLPFTFCFLPLVAQLPLCLLGLPPDFSRPSPAARDTQTRQLRLDSSDETDQTAQTRQRPETKHRPGALRPLPTDFADRPNFVFWLFLSLVLPLSRCIKIEFLALKAPPSRLNIIGLGAFLEPLGNQG